MGDIMWKRDGSRLTRGTVQTLGERNATDASSKESRNSVIVINDSDSETPVEDNDDETSKADENDTLLSVIECTPKPSSSLLQKRKSKIPIEQNTKRPSIISLDNDSSVLPLSNIQESLLNEENICE